MGARKTTRSPISSGPNKKRHRAPSFNKQDTFADQAGSRKSIHHIGTSTWECPKTPCKAEAAGVIDYHREQLRKAQLKHSSNMASTQSAKGSSIHNSYLGNSRAACPGPPTAGTSCPNASARASKISSSSSTMADARAEGIESMHGTSLFDDASSPTSTTLLLYCCTTARILHLSQQRRKNDG